MSQVVHHGKAKIRIEARGCVDCGAEHSFSWEVAGTVKLFVAGNDGKPGRLVKIAVQRCGDCMKAAKRR